MGITIDIDFGALLQDYLVYFIVGLLIIVYLIVWFIKKRKVKKKMEVPKIELTAFLRRLREIEQEISTLREREDADQRSLFARYRNEEQKLREEYEYLRQKTEKIQRP